MKHSLGIRLGRRIKELREANGLTQLQLADLMGKTVETISNFERGKTLPSLITLEQMAIKLHSAMGDFFVDEWDKKPRQASGSREALVVRNAADLLAQDDLEIIAGVVKVLENQRRK